MNTSRISLATGGMMITTAVLVDIADFFLIGGLIGFLVGIPAAIFFGIWFSHEDVSMFDHSRVLGFLATVGAEMVPIVNNGPWWTIRVATTVISEWRSEPEI